MVRSATVGRNRLIDADPSSPVYFELRGLLLKTLGPEPLLRAALADVNGVEEAFIYGSWADPAEKSPAGIDVLVVGDPDVGEVYDAASAVEAEDQSMSPSAPPPNGQKLTEHLKEQSSPAHGSI